MAPEVFQERYSTKADIWSVGCVAIQMASGNPPWKDLELTNPVALFQHISQSTGPPEMKVMEADFTSGFRDGQNKLALFKNLVTCCFERVPEKRPCSGDLLVHSFFSEECSMSMDDSPESGLGLFNSPSPNSNIHGETMTMSPNWAANLSPILRLPIRRSNSGSGMIRSPMFSPPLPRRSTGKGANLLRSQHSPIPFSSPIPDDGEWPIWARKKSPVKRTVVEDKAAEEASVSQSNKLSGPAIVDSLVYSDDSWISSQREDFENGLSPPLAGLAFVKTPDSTVDEMDSTPTR
jgi:serine/threonine protein kinase